MMSQRNRTNLELKPFIYNMSGGDVGELLCF